MLWFGRDRKRILARAERLVAASMMVSLSLEKLALTLADANNAKYSMDGPTNMFHELVACCSYATAVALQGPAKKHLKNIGEIVTAVEKGREHFCERNAKLMRKVAEMMEHDKFVSASLECSAFCISPQMKEQFGIQNSGVLSGAWILTSIFDKEQIREMPDGFADKLVKTYGMSIVKSFENYWEK